MDRFVGSQCYRPLRRTLSKRLESVLFSVMVMENIGIDEEPEENERGDRAFRTAEKEGGMSLKQRLMEKQEQIMASHMARP